MFKTHYDLKKGWVLAFLFLPQAIQFNISDAAARDKVRENSIISISYTFLPSAGKNINCMHRTEPFETDFPSRP